MLFRIQDVWWFSHLTFREKKQTESGETARLAGFNVLVNDVREQVVFYYKKEAELRKKGGRHRQQFALREGH